MDHVFEIKHHCYLKPLTPVTEQRSTSTESRRGDSPQRFFWTSKQNGSPEADIRILWGSLQVNVNFCEGTSEVGYSRNRPAILCLRSSATMNCRHSMAGRFIEYTTSLVKDTDRKSLPTVLFEKCWSFTEARREIPGNPKLPAGNPRRGWPRGHAQLNRTLFDSFNTEVEVEFIWRKLRISKTRKKP